MPLSFTPSTTSVSGTFSLFNAEADAIFRQLQKQRLRIGTQDLRIAAIALLHSFTVVTSNVRDFAPVPNLKVEDWTATRQ